MITDKTINLLKSDEGFKGKPYLCTAGKTSIAYGRNLDDNPLTPEEGEYLLRRDLADVEKKAQNLFPNFDELDEVRQAVLISMVYQLGVAGVAAFRNFRKAVEAEQWTMARFHGLDSKWARSDSPARANRLMLMLERGVW